MNGKKYINILRYYIGVTKHKLYVTYYISIVCVKLLKRALLHDLSKYGKIETDGFAQKYGRLCNVQYGSEEYSKLINEEKEIVNYHYRLNSHHPEYHDNDYTKMSLLDCIEMLCDWRASIKKNVNGCINRSFIINKQRFNLSNEIERLLKSLI